MAEWVQISADHPNKYSFSLASRRGIGCRLIEAGYEKTIVWSYQNATWTQLPDIDRGIGSQFAIVYDENVGDFVVYNHDHNEKVVHRFCLNDPTKTQTITHPAFANSYPDSFSVVWHDADGCAVLLFHHHVMTIPSRWDTKTATPTVRMESSALAYWELGYDPRCQKVFATRVSESRIQYLEGGTLASSAWCGEMRSTASYIASKGGLCALARGDDPPEELWGLLHLRKKKNDDWKTLPHQFDTAEALNPRLTLFEDPDTGKLVVYGSLDDASGGSSYQITLTEADGGLRPLTAKAHQRAPHTILSHTEDGVWLHDLSAGQTHRRDASGAWSPLWNRREETSQPVLGRDSLVCTSPNGTHYALHQYHGTIHQRGATPKARWKQLTKSEQGGPGTTHLRRMSMGWDPVGNRPVVFSGYDDDRTYTLTGKKSARWKEISTRTRPGLGLGSMACTPEGLYLACYAELWRLVGDEWVCVGLLPSGAGSEEDDFWKQSTRHALCHDPRRNVLLAAYERAGDTGERDTACVGWLNTTNGQWRDAIALPAVSIERLGGLEVDMEIDPIRDELLIMGINHAYRVPLGELGLPESGALPTKAVTPATQLIDPPASALSPAWRLAPSGGNQQPIQPDALPLPFALPSGSALLAVLPHHPEMKSGRKWFDALVVLETSDASFSADTPITPVASFMDSVKIIPIKGWAPEAPLYAYAYGEGLKASTWQAYQELEPQPYGARVYKMRDEDRWADKSKMGGWARYFRRITGPEMDRVSLQLESTVAGYMIYIRLWQGGGEFDLERI